jgi:hypothetical protein
VAEAVCLRCLKKKQAERFPKPKDLIEAIDQVLSIIDPEGKSAPNGKGVPGPKAKTGKIAAASILGRRGTTGKISLLKKQKSDTGKIDASAARAGGATNAASPDDTALTEPHSAAAKPAALKPLIKRSGPARRRPSAEGAVEDDDEPQSSGTNVLPIVLIGAALLGLLVGAILLFQH